MAFPPADPDAVGTLIVHDTFAGLGDGVSIDGRSPDTVDINSVTWLSPGNAWRGTAAGGQANATINNRFLNIETQTDHWYAEVTIDGYSSIGGTPPRVMFGGDGVENYFSANGYSCQAVSTTTAGLQQIRLTRIVSSASDPSLQTESNANTLWPDGAFVQVEYDGSGADAVLSCRVTRAGNFETIEYTDTDASKHVGSGHRFFGLMTALVSDVKIWDLDAAPASVFSPYRMLLP